jgi:acyl-coenzyme A thioesterase PaaI-like protein
MVSTLLDAAMTNCLFAHGCIAVTAELTVRFLRPVTADRPVAVTAWVEKSRHRLYLLAAELRQGGRLMATAAAKFIVCRPRSGMPSRDACRDPLSHGTTRMANKKGGEA